MQIESILAKSRPPWHAPRANSGKAYPGKPSSDVAGSQIPSARVLVRSYLLRRSDIRDHEQYQPPTAAFSAAIIENRAIPCANWQEAQVGRRGR